MSGALETPRLVLRPQALHDAPGLAALARNPSVASRIGGVALPHLDIAAEGRILINQARAPLNRERTFSIVRIVEADAIGEGGVYWRRDGGVEIGYWIGQPFWGHGYATEAAVALRDCAATLRTGAPVLAVCEEDNCASARVLEKAGFAPTGGVEMRFALSRAARVRCLVLRFTPQAQQSAA